MDILSRLGDTLEFEDIESEEIVVDGLPIMVASPRALYGTKKATVRPQDRVDAEALRRHLDLDVEE